jgi:hypothetical protein
MYSILFKITITIKYHLKKFQFKLIQLKII